MPYLGKDYILGNAGSLCSEKAFGIIWTIEECRKSFLAIKLMYPDAKNKVRAIDLGYLSRPKGCFFNLKNKALYWNPDKKGGSNKNDRQVCNAKGNFFKQFRQQ